MTQSEADAVATSADNDEIRLTSATTSQVAQQASPTRQSSAIIVPRKVATPLPPRNPSQTGNRCPRKEHSAATCAASSPTSARASSTATAPLAPSSSNVAAAAPLLPVRSTLVAPMLPDPMARKSPRPNARVTSTPKGIEPRR